LSAAFAPTFVTVTSAATGCPGATASGRVCFTERAGCPGPPAIIAGAGGVVDGASGGVGVATGSGVGVRSGAGAFNAGGGENVGAGLTRPGSWVTVGGGNSDGAAVGGDDGGAGVRSPGWKSGPGVGEPGDCGGKNGLFAPLGAGNGPDAGATVGSGSPGLC